MSIIHCRIHDHLAITIQKYTEDSQKMAEDEAEDDQKIVRR